MATDAPRRHCSPGWLAVRLLLAIGVTAAVYGWGHEYLFIVPIGMVSTPEDHFRDYLRIVVMLMLMGLLPAAVALLIEMVGERRTLLRTACAAVIPNVVGGFFFALVIGFGGLTLGSLLAGVILAGLGTVTFFLALIWRCRARATVEGNGHLDIRDKP